MAKSIYAILDDLTTETSVPKLTDSDGNVTRENLGEIVHTIPRELLPTAEEFESEEKLLEWATECGYLHSCLQKGVQKFLIEIRAAFKSCKKDDVWTEEYGQANVDKMEWKVTNRPNQGGSKAISEARLEAGIQMAKAMKLASLDDDTILASLTPVYGDDVATAIMEQITE